MTREFNIEMPTKGLDDLFSTQAEREDEVFEKVQRVPRNLIDGFPDHPFKVRMDDEMIKLIESVKKYGVLIPCLIRPKPDGRYEMVSGHRRDFAVGEAGITEIPAIVRQMSDEEATIIMVDSNLQREKILPSEKAFAYKMKMDAMKKKAGRPSNKNLRQLGANSFGQRTDEMIAEKSEDSARQILRYIRLTNLIPEVLEMVDNERIKFNPAVELSFLSVENQRNLYEIMDADQCTPSHDQAIRMKQAEAGGYLNKEHIFAIMQEIKGNQIEQFKIPKKSIERFFPPGAKRETVEETIVKALEIYVRHYNRTDHDRNDERER